MGNPEFETMAVREIWSEAERQQRLGRESHHEPQKGIKFDPTFNFGHLVSLLAFLIAGFSAWTTVDKRLTIVEERIAMQQQIDRNQDAQLKDSISQIKESINYLIARIDRGAGTGQPRNLSNIP